jgi:hypothetical protein
LHATGITKELDDFTLLLDSVFFSEELDPFDSTDAPLRVTLDEDFSLSTELLLDLGCLAGEELSASDADEDESSPHAARNATTLKTTKNFFIKNVIIILD